MLLVSIRLPSDNVAARMSYVSTSVPHKHSQNEEQQKKNEGNHKNETQPYGVQRSLRPPFCSYLLPAFTVVFSLTNMFRFVANSGTPAGVRRTGAWCRTTSEERMGSCCALTSPGRWVGYKHGVASRTKRQGSSPRHKRSAASRIRMALRKQPVFSTTVYHQ